MECVGYMCVCVLCISMGEACVVCVCVAGKEKERGELEE